MSTEERWPELAKVKERYPDPKPSFQEMLATIMPDFLEILRHQAGLVRNPVRGMVQVDPQHWIRPNPGQLTGDANMLTGPDGSLVPDPYGHLVPDPYGHVSNEDRELMEHCLAELEPEIKRQTEELLKTEIRDSMVLGGNWARLKELLNSGEKPRVLRKRQGGRDPLFLVFGDGVNKEIEEVRILG